ncbi:MAG TPA: fibronectin type III domain-containing protein, partial [Candidatus Limnocylindrales bacterium]|nr:fibronectin type III domain-containing protein [Candidatus Limnocylindrales bacterium]
GSPSAVRRFAECLRSVAGAYRRGLDPGLTRSIGIDTNYVAAMEQAAKHLPADAVRPTLILFSDGKHDVADVPIGQVAPARDRLFGSRSPFALLPVGMGLDPAEREALETGLVQLRIIADIPPCAGGNTVFDWQDVVFESPADAGDAVAEALQAATCTFTVAPTPTQASGPGVVHGIRLTAGDGRIELTWSPPAATSVPIVDYRSRCRAGTGDWIESEDDVSLETRATVEGLTNGTAYECEVAAVGASSIGAWTAASATATPVDRPAAPGKPTVEALDGALQISVAADAEGRASGYHYECSSDNGSTWTDEVDVSSADTTTARIDSLTNGTAYVCRAFGVNAAGLSDPSPMSDAVKPCGSVLECNSLLVPILGVLGVVLVGGLLLMLVAFYRDRGRGYVVAVVDVVHTANLGHGSSLGIGFVRAPGGRQVTGIVADRGPKADIRIRALRGGRFAVTDRTGRKVIESGEPIVVVDSAGVRHELVLRAFATRAASTVTSRR